jgi:hypothetical protein
MEAQFNYEFTEDEVVTPPTADERRAQADHERHIACLASLSDEDRTKGIGYEGEDDRTPDEKTRQRGVYHRAIARAQSSINDESWAARRMQTAEQRQWKSAEDLATWLAGEWEYREGHVPNAEQRARIDRTARAIWATKASANVVPMEQSA